MKIAATLLPVLALLALCLHAFQGAASLTAYIATDFNRELAHGLLEGRLAHPRPLLSGLPLNDFEIFNGAYYTHWGLGVPLLLSPFDLAARLLGIPPIYDRLIFFLYLCATTILLFSTFRRVFARAGLFPAALTPSLAAIATAAALGLSLFPILLGRFLVYEETICYFVLAQLAALASYLRFRLDRRLSQAIAIAAFAGLGLLIRPTGLFYLVGWLTLLYLARPREGGIRPHLAGFLLTAALPCAAWLGFNYLKSGSPFSLGFQNSTPFNLYHLGAVRFGMSCNESLDGFLRFTAALLTTLFVSDRKLTMAPGCMPSFEEDLPVPYLGPLPLIAAIAATFLAWRREALVPWITILVLVAGFASAGIGISGRYTGDLWPSFLLLMVLPLLRGELPRWRRVGALALFPLLTTAVWALRWNHPVKPAWLTDTVQAGVMPTDQAGFDWRMGKTPPPTLPSEVRCGDSLYPLQMNGAGWDDKCGVAPVTNLFLGLPDASNRYRLDVAVETPPGASPLPARLRVYLNGRYYWAEKLGHGYSVSFPLDRARMKSPVVQLTLQWSKSWSESPDWLGLPRPRLREVRLSSASPLQSAG